MNIAKYLSTAGVPQELHADALACLEEADRKSDGLTWAKWRVRLFEAGAISKLLPWAAERLLDVRPDLADWDIAPMVNITAHGDNCPWVGTPDGARPAPGQWLDQNPESPEHQQAIKDNYWSPGLHPRSTKSRKAWYRRNAGEFLAWRLGIPVDLAGGVTVWRRDGVTVYRCGAAWQVIAHWKLLGLVPMTTRVGYEINNIWNEEHGVQSWYPIDGYELRAPLTWSILPKKD